MCVSVFICAWICKCASEFLLCLQESVLLCGLGLKVSTCQFPRFCLSLSHVHTIVLRFSRLHCIGFSFLLVSLSNCVFLPEAIWREPSDQRGFLVWGWFFVCLFVLGLWVPWVVSASALGDRKGVAGLEFRRPMMTLNFPSPHAPLFFADPD